MKMVLFNLHDLILFAVLAACGLLAALTLSATTPCQRARHLLIAFLTMNSLIAVDTLFFWGEGVRPVVFEVTPWLLTIFSIAVFAFGPILLGLIRCELHGNASLRWPFLLHFIPALLTPVYFYWVCHRFPLEVQRDLILNLGLYSSPDSYFALFTSLKKLVPAVYGIVCLCVVIKGYRGLPAATNRLSKAKLPQNREVVFLLYLTTGFAAIRLWVLLAHWCGLYLPASASDFMGIAGNYLTLALLLGLVWLCIQLPSSSDRVPCSDKGGSGGSGAQDNIDQESEARQIAELKDEIAQFVENEKPYLNTRLTLHRFAESLGVSERQVSLAINKGFHKNFQEYINDLRVKEAIRLMRSPQMHQKTVLEIANLAGFNSKSSFNRIFKRYTELTPSSFRQQC